MQIARRYLVAQRSFVDLVEGLTDDEWATPVPCTPGWTVHDVLSHLAGVTIDVAEGNVEGAATEPWTAVQVDRWRTTPRSDLIATWNEQIGPVAEAIEAFGEFRPPIDCHTHEHDVRHALGRPGNRDSELIAWMAELFGAFGRPVVVSLADGASMMIDGVGDQIALSGVTTFELVRSRLGRRSSAQVLSWNWSEPPTQTELDEWFMFGPSPLPIHE